MGETVATREDGTVEFDKDKLLDLLRGERDRAKAKIKASVAGEDGGQRARYDACEKLHKQISPLDEAAIGNASEAGEWLKQPFPFDLDERLAELAADAILD